MKELQTGMNFDRFLMRLKDFIIIGTAIYAMIHWAYTQTNDISQRFKSLEDRMANAERILAVRNR